MYHSKKDPTRWARQRAYTAGYDEGYKVAVWFPTRPQHEVSKEHILYPQEWETGFMIGFATKRKKLEDQTEGNDHGY